LPRVTLTFDNGPHATVTPRVLDVLNAHKLQATFFVVGSNVTPETEPLLDRMQAEGHWIGNHSFTHSVPLGLMEDETAASEEIEQTEARIAGHAHRDHLFRPFGGGGKLGNHLLSHAAVEHLCRNGYSCVLWNAVPHDWEDPQGWVYRALVQCALNDWALVVLHDIPGAAADRLEEFLVALEAGGHTFMQDFPPDCVPIRRGEIRGDLSAIVGR
jgi:peptidoglycan/xylan/chitin deacetylase (PgdA/CDA1 family)